MKKVHQENAIHRDLKLQNIFLDDNFEPLIGGFEIARFIKSDLNMTMMVDAPLYMAPELFMDGPDTYGTSVDVFLYAVLLYKMFSNSVTFDNQRQPRSATQYMIAISKGNRPRRPDHIPDHYWDLINKCWIQDPFKRPTFDEIVEILKSDKYAIEEFGMNTNIDELHSYQNRIEQEEKSTNN